MLPSKTAAAFQLTVRKLREQNDHLYFWTMTFKQCVSDIWAMYMWKLFCQWLLHWCNGNVKGVRVVELHKTHGVHFHMIINRRIPAQIVRRAAARWGFGRNHVRECWDGAAAYLSKYMTKEYRRAYPCGMRRWACIGGFEGTKVRDLKLECLGETNRRSLFGSRKVHIAGIQMTYMLTDFFGHVDKWPERFVHGTNVAAGVEPDFDSGDEWWIRLKRDSRGMTPFELDLFAELNGRKREDEKEKESLTKFCKSVTSGCGTEPRSGSCPDRV